MKITKVFLHSEHEPIIVNGSRVNVTEREGRLEISNDSHNTVAIFNVWNAFVIEEASENIFSHSDTPQSSEETN
jgi:hypothetical protein